VFIVRRTKTGTAMRTVAFTAAPRRSWAYSIQSSASPSAWLRPTAAGGGNFYAECARRAFDPPLDGRATGACAAFTAAVVGGIGKPARRGAGRAGDRACWKLSRGRFRACRITGTAIAFAILILILLFKPAGLLGKATVEKV